MSNEYEDFLKRDSVNLVRQHADEEGIDPDFAERVLRRESRLRPDILTGRLKSPAGATGPMQLMPGTAKDLGVDINDYEDNIRGGVKYLAQQVKTFKDPKLAAAAYNAGPGNVTSGKYKAFKETQGYIKEVAPDDDPAQEARKAFKDFQDREARNNDGGVPHKTYTPGSSVPVKEYNPLSDDTGVEHKTYTIGSTKPVGEYKAPPESTLSRRLKNVGEGLRGAAANYAKDFAFLGMGNPANIGQGIAQYMGADKAKQEVPEDRSTAGKITRGVTQGIAEAPKYVAAGMAGPLAGPILGGAALVEGNLADRPVETLTNAAVQTALPGVAGRIAPTLGKIFGRAAPAVTPGLVNVGAGYATRKAEKALGVDVPDTTLSDVATEFITGSALGAKDIVESLHPAAGRTGNTDIKTEGAPARPQAVGPQEQAAAVSRNPYADWDEASLMLQRDSHVRDLNAALKDNTKVYSGEPGAEPTADESAIVEKYQKARDGLAAVNAELLKRDQVRAQQAQAVKGLQEQIPAQVPSLGVETPGYSINETTVERPEGGWGSAIEIPSQDAQAETPIETGAQSVGIQLPENWAQMAWDRQMAQGADPAETLSKIQAVDPNFTPPEQPQITAPGAKTPEDASENWPTYGNAAEIGSDLGFTGSPQAGTPTATAPPAVSPVRPTVAPVKQKTPFGSFWSDLHKGPTRGGGDSFFQDQNVKDALNLPPEASSKEVQKAIKEEMAGARGVTSTDISSANISPAELFAWARTKGLDKAPDTWNKINWAAHPDKRNEISFSQNASSAEQPNVGSETPVGNAESGNPDEVLSSDSGLQGQLRASIAKETSGSGKAKRGRGGRASQPEESGVPQEAAPDVHEAVAGNENVDENAGTPETKGTLKAFRKDQGPSLRDIFSFKKSMGPSEPIPDVELSPEMRAQIDALKKPQVTEEPARPAKTAKETPKRLTKVQELKARKAEIEAGIQSGEITERHGGLGLAGVAGRSAKRFAEDLNDTARATQMIGHFTAPFKQGAYYSWARPEDMTKTWGNMAKGWIKGQAAHDATFSALSQTHSAEVGREAGIYHAGEADLQHQIADLKTTLQNGYGIDRRDINDATGPVTKAGYSDLKQARDVLDGWVKRLKDSGRAAKGTYEPQEDYVKRRNTLEETQQSRLLESIPGLKQLFGASKRGFNGFLDTQRQLVWDNFVKTQEAQGRTFETHPQMYKDMAKVINSRTGRGDLGALNKYSEFLGDAFYSPRYIKSRIELLDPRFYAGKKFDPEVNKQNRKDAVKMIRNGTAVFAALKGLGALTGTPVEFGTDPDESDFGKLKIGDRVVQVFSGAEDIARLIARTSMAIHGEEGDPSYWDADEDERVDRNKKALGVIGRFVRSKLGPGASAIVDMSVGRDYMGKKATLGHEAAKSFTPFPAADIVQAIIEDETPDYVSSIPSMFGLRTYKKKEE